MRTSTLSAGVVALLLSACGAPAEAPQAEAAAAITLGAVPDDAIEAGAACWAKDAAGATVFASNGGRGFVVVNGALTELTLEGDGGRSATGAVRTEIATTGDSRELEPDVVGGPAELTVSTEDGATRTAVTFACLAGY